MFVSDLRHFLDLPDDAPGPARKMAEQLGNRRAGSHRRRGRYRLGVRAAVPPTAGTKTLPWSHHRLPA
ncbi:MAG: hypothetical protein M0Z46_15310 [Actinomycetota bacterium]|jgi:hypothetical protein|nr:hypothetical protein [Actinomycetota bacterium]